MTEKLRKILDLEYQILSYKDTERRKMADVEFLLLSSNFNVTYPENLKQFAHEIGFGKAMLLQHDFYDCLYSYFHYKAALTKDFIKLLLDLEFSYSEIENLEFDIIKETFNYPMVDELYLEFSKDFDCVEIAINTFDDAYNCHVVLVLTGEKQGMIFFEEWQHIQHDSHDFSFSSFNPKALLEDFIIDNMKKVLARNNR